MNINHKISLRDNEQIITTVQSSALAHFWKYFLGVVLLAAFSFFMFRLFLWGWWGKSLFLLGMFAGSALIFKTWFFHKHNICVITSERMVDVHRHGFFNEEISSVGYLDIQDISVNKKGILAGLFDCGHIIVETKSRQFVLEICHVRHPQAIQSVLSDTDVKYRQNRRVSNKLAIYNSFIKIIPDLSVAELLLAQKNIDDRLSICHSDCHSERSEESFCNQSII